MTISKRTNDFLTVGLGIFSYFSLCFGSRRSLVFLHHSLQRCYFCPAPPPNPCNICFWPHFFCSTPPVGPFLVLAQNPLSLCILPSELFNSNLGGVLVPSFQPSLLRQFFHHWQWIRNVFTLLTPRQYFVFFLHSCKSYPFCFLVLFPFLIFITPSHFTIRPSTFSYL